MPIFGDTTQGGSSFPCSGGRVIVGKFTLAEAGDVESITVFFASGQSAGTNFKGLIYSDNAGAPDALLAVGGSVAVPGTTGGELTSTLAAPVSLAAGDYWIGAVVNSFEARWSCDAGIGGFRKEGVSFASPASTFGTPDDTTGDRVSAYATYTVAGDPGDATSDDLTSDGLVADATSDDLTSDALAADAASDAAAADAASDQAAADAASDDAASDAANAGGGASAAQVWAYVLPNGKTAAQTLVEINDGIDQILLRRFTDEGVQGLFTVGDVLRVLAAVAAGKTTIQALGGGAAEVTFRAIDDSGDVIVASMEGSERAAVAITPTETS